MREREWQSGEYTGFYEQYDVVKWNRSLERRLVLRVQFPKNAIPMVKY